MNDYESFASLKDLQAYKEHKFNNVGFKDLYERDAKALSTTAAELISVLGNDYFENVSATNDSDNGLELHLFNGDGATNDSIDVKYDAGKPFVVKAFSKSGFTNGEYNGSDDNYRFINVNGDLKEAVKQAKVFLESK